MTEAMPEVLPAPAVTAATAVEGSRNPFNVRGFWFWFVASVFAGSGVGIQSVTVPLFIRDRVSEGHRAPAIALALICQTLPGASLTLFGGVVADRVERRRILVRTYLVAAAVSLIYVALSGADVSVIWPVFILSAIVGSAGAFTNPARQSMMPQLLSQSQLQNGAIFGTMAFMATLQFLGPSMGGVLADGPGLTFAFGAEVAMLGAAALLFSLIATDVPVPTGKSVLRDLLEGLRYVNTNRSLLGILALGTVPGVLLIGPFQVTVVLIVDDVFHESDKFVGFFWGALGGGIVAGSIIMSMLRLKRRGLLLCSSLLMGGFFWMLYGLAPNVPLAMLAMFFAGIFGPAIFINFAVALLQENTERNMMGRVMSLYGLSFVASTPLGHAQTALQVWLWGPQSTVVVSAVLALVIGIAAMLFLKPVTRLP
ncbi:MAG: MFS transporter [Dehalococcoidia bacterium]